MSHGFHHIAILGGGLLGGSLALALGRLPVAPQVTLWARRAATVDEATALGIPSTADLHAAVETADLIVLAVPVGAMPALVAEAITAGLPEDCTITDVGSVKQTPHAALEPLLAGSGRVFVGSHPMAGSEKNGLSAAREDLFENAACLITNHAAASVVASVEAFWRSVGCRTAILTAVEHDALVARISHLPHIVAAAAAQVCLAAPADGAFGGGGLRDTTRVAAGNPDMWAEILTENRAAILTPLRETCAELQRVLAILESGDQDAARQWLAAAKTLRDQLSPTPPPASHP